MKDFNSNLSRILCEFDDEYADLEDEDEFEEDVLRLIGEKQFGDITARLYTDDYATDLRFAVNGVDIGWDNSGEYRTILDKCWRLAGFSEETYQAEIDAWLEKVGLTSHPNAKEVYAKDLWHAQIEDLSHYIQAEN